MSVFDEFLSEPAETAKRPPPLPVGHYGALIVSYDLTSRGKQDTRCVIVKCRLTTAHADVNIEMLPPGELSSREITVTLWVTPDASYRITELWANIGLDISKSRRVLLEEMIGRAVIIRISKRGENTNYDILASSNSATD